MSDKDERKFIQRFAQRHRKIVGTRHKRRTAYGIPGTASAAEVYDEVTGNQDRLFTLTGLGLTPLGFSINGDGGATFPAATALREVSSAKAGDIVIGHANHPAGGTAAGLTRALQDLSSRGIQPVPFTG